MSRAIDRWLIFTALLTLVFGVLLWLNRDAESNASYFEGSNSVELCQYIELDMLKTDVQLIPYNGSKIKFEYKSLVPIEVLLGDNRLIVNESDELSVSFLTGDSSQFFFKLYLPKETYRSVIVYTSSGNVDIGAVKAEAVSIVTNSGNVAAYGTRSPVSLVSGSGDILLDFEQVTDSSLETRSGNAQIRFPEGSSVALSYETDTGSFHTDLMDINIKGSYMYSFSGGEKLITASVLQGILTLSEKTVFE